VTLVADLPLADHFDAGSVGYGLLTALWGLGAVAGSWAAARWLRPSGEALGLALGTAAMAVSLGSIAAMPAFAPIVLVGTIGGIGSGYAFTPWFTMVQRQTEDVHRGRVFAAAEACEQGAFVVGMLVAGWIVDAVGPRPTYLVPGMLLALGAAIAARIWRSIPASVAVPAARPPGAVSPNHQSAASPSRHPACNRRRSHAIARAARPNPHEICPGSSHGRRLSMARGPLGSLAHRLAVPRWATVRGARPTGREPSAGPVRLSSRPTQEPSGHLPIRWLSAIKLPPSLVE
jgi:MFS family permease